MDRTFPPMKAAAGVSMVEPLADSEGQKDMQHLNINPIVLETLDGGEEIERGCGM